MKGSKLGIRLLYYFGGFFVMTIGIALSVKSNLGRIAGQLHSIHHDLRLGH